ncbi:DUF559 domain-containing protein [Rhodococcus artemisiae]|uniref:DUF559 domain-containing protein n=1 Tax=Rhodococcus artemisiae TaxID=714159 RepID=A0ABU7LER7_9NOCA|nr:DUF559 domain-containing protein [Rhodococcus artemisiae]MEE2059774.1 DUF559 domain-containing protein [Rhodococcus artemisiae]
MGDFDVPFLGTEAVAAGRLTQGQLRSFRRVHRGVYIDPKVSVTPILRAQAAWLWSGRRGVLAGRSAAALHGCKWIDTRAPAELIRSGSRRAAAGLVIHGDTLLDDEVCHLDSMAVTSPARTGFDLGRWLDPDDAIAQLDALCRVTHLTPCDIHELAERHPRERGLTQLGDVLRQVDPGAESIPETRVRLLLIRGGLPVPETQVPIVDGSRILARADMGWRQWRTAVEYDGIHHWTDERQRTRDIERYEACESLGWSMIRVNSEQLRRRPASIVNRVRLRLRAAGAPV